MQPWGANRWWPLALMLLLTAALLGAGHPAGGAGATSAPGCCPDRAGPRVRAPARYATPLGLGLRLQRGPIIGWTLTIAAQRPDVRLRRRGDDRADGRRRRVGHRPAPGDRASMRCCPCSRP